jgi:tRNA(Arg) A34 adenosine deaminase TadA
MLPFMAIEGPAATALREAMARRGVTGTIDNSRQRAALDASGDAEAYLRGGLGAKKLKELRRLANRMADEGAVQFAEAREPGAIAAALERFLKLEASGWKGRRGTGLGQDAADARFIRAAAAGLGAPRLPGCDLYVTLEPCAMCATAVSFARLRRIVFGAYDPKGGGVDHGPRIFAQATCHHRPEIVGGVESARAENLLKGFFGERR